MTALGVGAGRLRTPGKATQMQRARVVGAVALACAAALALHPVARAISYDAWVDGPAPDYARNALFAALLAAGTWLAVRTTLPPQPTALRLMPWVAALAVLAPDDVVHLMRARHPSAVTGALVIEDEFDRGSQPSPTTWIVEQNGGSIAIGDGAATISSPAGSTAFLDLLFPSNPKAEQILLPRGLVGSEHGESLEWRAALSLAGSYAIVVQTRQLLVEATRSGLHLTYAMSPGNSSDYYMAIEAVSTGLAHDYRLERADGVIRLRVDDASGWVMLDAGSFGLVRFGQTRADPLHGGTLTLERVRYVRRYAGWRSRAYE